MIHSGIKPEIHGRVIWSGFGPYMPVCNSVIDIYGKCNTLDRSVDLFDEISEKDVSYNAVLGAHAKLGEDMPRAQRLFDHMPDARKECCFLDNECLWDTPNMGLLGQQGSI
ncbi:hypothetical protein NE237_018370 [Protea cynaroides]|uniref:Pentatricopeptide repeat protein n=1 Tax=Protea cynaroides TaxID=273540 RepID=A0A9Q0K9R9_9MAGN|nr:hypothetical protein NE237_018370 [Protea cynaroides]